MEGRGTTGEWRRVLLYFGGMMGPLGTFVMLPMIPELRSTFSVTTGQIGWALWCYLVPFAGLLLVSGTIADRWGRARVLRPAVALYAVATLGCAIAPTYVWFLVARVAQGSMNAFITPLLLAMLTETAPTGRVGRVVGRYAAFQALGQLSAPMLGGIGADTNWRLAYVATAAVGALIALLLPKASTPDEPATASTPISPPQLRTLMRRSTLLVAATAMLAALGPVGARILVALSGRDVIGLTGSQVGVLLFAGGGCRRHGSGAVMGHRAGPLGGAAGSHNRHRHMLGTGGSAARGTVDVAACMCLVRRGRSHPGHRGQLPVACFDCSARQPGGRALIHAVTSVQRSRHRFDRVASGVRDQPDGGVPRVGRGWRSRCRGRTGQPAGHQRPGLNRPSRPIPAASCYACRRCCHTRSGVQGSST